MVKCLNCAREIADGDTFCKYCGASLVGSPGTQATGTQTTETQTAGAQAYAGSSVEGEVENTVRKRLDGIKNKDEGAVRALVDEHYSKFDDWAPFKRQEAAEALENEFSAFKVLSGYSYELKDFEVNVLGDTAVATFQMHYQGTIRNRSFDVNSRVTTVLKKENSGWKVVHEHFSRFPDQTPQRQYMPPRRMMQP
jgi:ketosteroid isomerase-like protein